MRNTFGLTAPSLVAVTNTHQWKCKLILALNYRVNRYYPDKEQYYDVLHNVLHVFQRNTQGILVLQFSEENGANHLK